MVFKKRLFFLLLILFPVATTENQCVKREDSVEEQKVIDEMNKLEDEIKKKQEEAGKVLDEIVAQIEHGCGVHAGCHPGWVKFKDSCYYVIDTPTTKWSDARRTCQNLGGDLAIVRSADENRFIYDLIRKQDTYTDWGTWLGFYRKADSKFYWVDNTPLDGNYEEWGSTEPNDAGGLENCGCMFGKVWDAGKWNDLTCDVTDTPSHKLPEPEKEAPVILCQKSV